MAFTILDGGSFTSTGAGVKILLPSSADYFQTWNITQLAASNPNTVTNGQWFGPKFGAGASAAGSGIKTVKTTAMLDSAFAAGTGFTYVTSSPIVEPQAANAITGITAANPAVVSQTNTYSDGDILRIYNTTGDLTIGGMTFEISSSSGSGYTLLGLANIAGNGLAAATAGNTRRVSANEAVDPQYMYITNISQATQAVVSTSVDPSRYYVVGNKIHLSVPSSFGMTQANQLTGTIVAINAVAASGNIGAYNMTLDIDSSAFTAFAFPASALSPTAMLFATLSPAGSQTSFNPNTGVQTGYEFTKTPFHTGQFVPYMYLAGGAQSPAGANNDVINWVSYKLET
ncbi:MAG: hypothetical protein IT281_09960 [Ignavibacteria bacterium]|nr:hypothetical protein [Ignavibacteria bacterium]